MTASRTAVAGESGVLAALRQGVDAGASDARVLDEIDHGIVVVVADDARVVFLNHAARSELDAQHPLQLLGQSLGAHRPQDVSPLFDALESARRGLRRLLVLGSGKHRVGVAVVPLHGGPVARAGRAPQLALLVLGRRQPCSPLTLAAYARHVKLTPAETRVLELISRGVPAAEIARRAGVAVSTVRTQIGGIRAKTGAGSIHDVVRQLALLPPMVPALRHNGSAGDEIGAG